MNELIRQSIPRSVWHGWGDPAEAHPLADRAWAALAKEIGPQPGAPRTPVSIDQVELPETALDSAARLALVASVGEGNLHDDRVWRIEHAGGKGYPDLYRLRTGDGTQAPDLVVVPADAAEVQRVVDACVRHNLVLVPFGGGTSVVGGVGRGETSGRPVVALDVRRLNRLLHVDVVARTATFEPGLRGPEIEAALYPYGLTLGHYPQSHQEATLGGYVATRSAGQSSSGYGRIDDNVLGVTLATPRGTLVLGGRAPATATGPSLLDVVVGSEGTFGIITEATLTVAPLPTAKRYAAWAFPSTAAGVDTLRAIAQDLGPGIQPDVCRLSDEEETRVNLVLAGRSGSLLLRYVAARGLSSPALLILIWEGTDTDTLKGRQRACERLLRRAAARRLPGRVAMAWETGRFSGPYLRDQLMDRGVFVETIETATTWDNLSPLHDAVGNAIRTALETQGHRAIVMAHLSHIYAAGASIYFTFAASEGSAPLAQWQAVKSAASEAILAAGGTITHHHGVGTHHRPYLTAEISELGASVLRAIKTELDPTGILNPGKLIPAMPAPADAQHQPNRTAP